MATPKRFIVETEGPGPVLPRRAIPLARATIISS